MVGFGGLNLGDQGDDAQNMDDDVRWAGRKGVRGASWSKMPLLTIGLLGAQIVWSTEMGYASPYLLSLGLSKSLMSVVFVAGPLSGLIVQPLIGVLADNSTSRFGRRRPYMLAGSLICAVAMLVLGFTRDVAGWFSVTGSDWHTTLTLWLAVFSIYLIDFSINAVQAADRALIVDTLSTSQQERGNAWAGRMLSFGSVVGFWVGNFDLPALVPIFGKSQLQVLSVITSLLLLAAHGVTCLSVRERVLLAPRKKEAKSGGGGLKALKDIWENVWRLPWTIQQICLIQFFSWIGWFPVLFFSTVYIGDLYTHPIDGSGPPTPAADTTLAEEATRHGFRALLYSALVGLATIILLPLIISSTRGGARSSPRPGGDNTNVWSGGVKLAIIWAISQAVFALCMGATFFVKSVWGASIIIGITGFCFAVSQWVPFSLLGEAILIEAAHQSESESGYYTPLNGRTSPTQEDEETGGLSARGETIPLRARRASPDPDHEEEAVTDQYQRDQPLSSSGRHVVFDMDLDGNDGLGGDNGLDEDMEMLNKRGRRRPGMGARKGSNIGDKAGIILGIHNVSIVIPQFLVTGLSSIIFAIMEPPKSGVLPGAGHAGAGVGAGAELDPTAAIAAAAAIATDEAMNFVKRMEAGDGEKGSDATAVIFRIGGVCSIVACVLCWRLAMGLKGMRK